MILLRFRAENHRSLRDEAELSLVRTNHKGAMPKTGDWADSTLRVAGIYGANASGKSTMIHAMAFFRDAIKRSATTWSGRKMPFMPFALDEESKHKPSSYSADFIVKGVRYEYGFSSLEGKVHSEWMFSYPEGRARILFERDENNVYKFGGSFRGGNKEVRRGTKDTELFLSRAAATQHEFLTEFHNALANGIVVTKFDEMDRRGRLTMITEGLTSGEIQFPDIIALLRMADVGISDVEVATHEMPDELRKFVQALMAVKVPKLGADEDSDEDEDQSEVDETLGADIDEEDLEDSLQRNLEFHHDGVDGKSNYVLSQSVQSTGTMSWLALAVPALECLRKGRVLLVDEIDASLHPQLALALIEMFKDPSTNPTDAQLLFTTHDTYYLSPTARSPLSDDEVWFAEKTNGATDLYSLADFGTRKNENFARRYLAGRYGAVPTVIPSLIAGLVVKEDHKKEPASVDLAEDVQV